MDTFEIELTVSEILGMSKKKAKKLTKDILDALKSDPSLTPEQAIAKIVNEYLDDRDPAEGEDDYKYMATHQIGGGFIE